MISVFQSLSMVIIMDQITVRYKLADTQSSWLRKRLRIDRLQPHWPSLMWTRLQRFSPTLLPIMYLNRLSFHNNDQGHYMWLKRLQDSFKTRETPTSKNHNLKGKKAKSKYFHSEIIRWTRADYPDQVSSDSLL